MSWNESEAGKEEANKEDAKQGQAKAEEDAKQGITAKPFVHLPYTPTLPFQPTRSEGCIRRGLTNELRQPERDRFVQTPSRLITLPTQ